MDNDGQLATVLSGTTAEQGGDEHDMNHLTHQLVSVAFIFHCFGNHFRLLKSAWQRKSHWSFQQNFFASFSKNFRSLRATEEKFRSLTTATDSTSRRSRFSEIWSLFGVLCSFCSVQEPFCGVCVCWVGSSLEVAITSISRSCFSAFPSTMWIMMCYYLPNNNTTDLKSKGAKKSTSDPKIIMCYQVASTYPTTTQLTSEKIKRSKKINIGSQNTLIWIAWHSSAFPSTMWIMMCYLTNNNTTDLGENQKEPKNKRQIPKYLDLNRMAQFLSVTICNLAVKASKSRSTK